MFVSLKIAYDTPETYTKSLAVTQTANEHIVELQNDEDILVLFLHWL